MNSMIEVQNLGKCYQLGGQDKYYKTLRESLVQGFKRPFQLLAGSANTDEDFWALRHVSFTVHEGEVVGIIGRNGAGKSTLLKLLSRITRPTEGCAKLYGRVGSLLEVGTGFHPELTGRENIYLSGNLLGMTRAEVKTKFDEIVVFSGVEKFLDTPVKHYSSGMYVRLGFAIAAHLEPEILLIDEVLAVGDAQFQRKCLGKMGDVAKTGRTVIFVSHNMPSIMMLCPRVLLMDGGLVADGAGSEVIRTYQSLHTVSTPGMLKGRACAPSPDAEGWICWLCIRDEAGAIRNTFDRMERAHIEIGLHFQNPLTRIIVAYMLYDSNHNLVMTSGTIEAQPDWIETEYPVGDRTFRGEIPLQDLARGTYTIQGYLGVLKEKEIDRTEGEVSLTIQSGKLEHQITDNRGSAYAPILPWRDLGANEEPSNAK